MFFRVCWWSWSRQSIMLPSSSSSCCTRICEQRVLLPRGPALVNSLTPSNRCLVWTVEGVFSKNLHYFCGLIEMTSKQSLVLKTSQVSFVCLSWPVLFWKHLWFVNCHLSLPSRGILEWVSNRSILSMWKWMQKVNYLSSILYKMCC